MILFGTISPWFLARPYRAIDMVYEAIRAFLSKRDRSVRSDEYRFALIRTCGDLVSKSEFVLRKRQGEIVNAAFQQMPRRTD